MKDPAIFDDQKKEKTAAESFYSEIKRAWCPTIGDFVYFGKLGFRHLIQKGRKFRTQSEQHRRLKLLPYALTILENRNTAITRRQGEKVKYWALKALRENSAITVVVLQIGNGKKYFVSVYAKKQKPMG